MFTKVELDYLAGQRLARLATSQPDGTLQVTPVGFQYNPGTETIDIVGLDMAASRKFRNVADNGRVALVVDDIPSQEPFRIRCLEIRGHAEALEASADGVDTATIRIYPRRIITLGIEEPDQEPRLLTHHSRNVTAAGKR